MDRLRLVTYNIHKGVQGLGPARRLEIHNLQRALAQLDAHLLCLQEVRLFHSRLQHRFAHWPRHGQAEVLAPEGYQAVYRTNAVTRHGEHGNALLSRWPVLSQTQHDVSDHRFEQRGLLHVVVQHPQAAVHVVVVHLGLIHASRVRQIERLGRYLVAEVPATAPLLVAGDFNDWGQRLHGAMAHLGLQAPSGRPPATFPSRMPLFALDRVYARGLRLLQAEVPHGAAWARLSDHLPLVVDWALT
jgi:endonuclease/exonuclease/phosphatase family metal-dependent hydrolase